jgi:hypothetical protein
MAIDTLSDARICSRDIPNLLNLGINTILTLGFNTASDHSACMRLFENSGIYVIAALNSNIDSGVLINGTWTVPRDYILQKKYHQVIDFLTVHPNLLGIVLHLSDVDIALLPLIPMAKATIRDIKDYLRRKGKTGIPVGAYGYNHRKSNLIAQYMGCGDAQIAVDFWVTHVDTWKSNSGFVWCANSSDGFNALAEQYRSYPVPTVVTYGCYANQSHSFQEPEWIYNGVGAEVFSGGIASEWFEDRQIEYPDTGKISTQWHLNVLIRHRVRPRSWS